MRPTPLLFLLAGCMLSGSAPEPEPAPMDMPDRFAAIQAAEEAPAKREEAKMASKPKAAIGDLVGVTGGGGAEAASRSGLLAIIAGDKGGIRGDGVIDMGGLGGKGGAPEPEAQAALREWFPEAFLWRPSVRTDAQGAASIDVRVPDQLTTWRVLALAHGDQGHQSGTEHTFRSTLPAYVDPVVPEWTYVGDQLTMPVLVQNNTDQMLRGALTVELDGALEGGQQGQVAISPFGADRSMVQMRATSAGQGTLRAGLSGVDRVERSWNVQPTGRPVLDQQGGTLTGQRQLQLTWPEGADPRTARFQVVVHPGPLAVLTQELERLDGGGGWGQSYAYGVLHHLQKVASITDTELDPEQVRRVQKRAWQRLVRRARSPNLVQASNLLQGLIEPQGSLEKTLRDRLVRTVVENQRGDGSFSRRERAPLQEVLVFTAATARALPESEAGARIRAGGAIERYQPNIEDPFTAAVVIASGLMTPTDAMLKTLDEGLVPVDTAHPDGPKTVKLPSDALSPFGGRATLTEMRAWMTLAQLQLDDPKRREVAGDLASQLMTTYGAGFGTGAAEPIVLEAVVRALPTGDQPIALSLWIDGEEISAATVDPAQPGVTAILEGVPPNVDPTTITLQAEPAGAGLAYAVTQHSWVPWTGREGIAGIDLEIAQSPLRAGEKGTLTMTLAAPSGASVVIVQGLPSGTVIDDLDALRRVSGIQSAEATAEQLTLVTTPFGAGEVREIPITVVPRYAGRMRTTPLELSSGGRKALMRPHVWTVQ